MKVLIHACPARMWYVEDFLYPSLRDQGLPAEDIEIWNDTEGKGNLKSCMESFAARPEGDGDTWHLQDDVIVCRDFVKRAELVAPGVAYGFCCEKFTDDIGQRGRVHQPDMWHSFQCVRIPDAYARECAAWFFDDARHRFLYKDYVATGKMDDFFFWAFMEDRHPRDLVTNVAPNLVNHVDWMIGGSVLGSWRGYIASSDLWEDDELLEDLKNRIKARGQ